MVSHSEGELGYELNEKQVTLLKTQHLENFVI